MHSLLENDQISLFERALTHSSFQEIIKNLFDLLKGRSASTELCIKWVRTANGYADAVITVVMLIGE